MQVVIKMPRFYSKGKHRTHVYTNLLILLKYDMYIQYLGNFAIRVYFIYLKTTHERHTGMNTYTYYNIV
jgi:hypothetical protein